MALCVTLAVLNSGAFPCMKSTTEFVKNSTPPFYASISPLIIGVWVIRFGCGVRLSCP